MIITQSGKRRPDVFCQYEDKRLAFEIQLSNLSLRYILSRYEFYQQNGIYLVWILDNFNVHDQSQMVRDIKYLNRYENFFKLDETKDSLYLQCQYKFPYITIDHEVHTKWLEKSVSLVDLSFNEETYELYYFDLLSEKNKRDEESKKLILQWEETQQTLRAQQMHNAATAKAREIITVIAEYRTNRWPTFERAKEMIAELNDYEVEVFNEVLDLKRSGDANKPAVHRWIHKATENDFGFLHFILGTEAIHFDVNETDDNGVTIFQELYANKAVQSTYYYTHHLFSRGYQLTEGDRSIIAQEYPDHSFQEPIILESLHRLSDRSLVKLLWYNSSLICILESAKRKKIVGFRYQPDAWAAFCNNAIQHYSKYWDYIEPAFMRYGIWEIITQVDRKGTFQKKLHAHYINMPEQQYDIDPIIQQLYPELSE